MEFIGDLISSIAAPVITVLCGIGFMWKYGARTMKLVNEMQELLTAIIIAFADKELTKEELETIIDEAKDVKHAAIAMIDKSKEKKRDKE